MNNVAVKLGEPKDDLGRLCAKIEAELSVAIALIDDAVVRFESQSPSAQITVDLDYAQALDNLRDILQSTWVRSVVTPAAHEHWATKGLIERLDTLANEEFNLELLKPVGYTDHGVYKEDLSLHTLFGEYTHITAFAQRFKQANAICRQVATENLKDAMMKAVCVADTSAWSLT